ncbi:hypothetical protein SNE25_15525 [Mucilaginibacter sabulilitoris]|uniref:Uncharacterized protein n=1 Tax=Mucilaginibacter sabulilitoris TaxID=1173583 RepID=A0ABZ0TV11_9SPHI|nr:hypothetical protein [Mucilaginibacter sabulilitoris]WPU96931.1 hypothetical protein SNE25_15525 [Mucilaginibacter sabulilitoris]
MNLINHKSGKSKILINYYAKGRDSDEPKVGMYEEGACFQAQHYRLDTRTARPVIKEAPREGLYKISLAMISFPIHESRFPPVANCSTLLFMHPEAKQPEQYKDGKCYECSFTPNYLCKKSVEISQIMNLFNSEISTAFLVNHTQEWRIEEIFESMIEESLVNRPFKSEMLQNLITELSVFTQRLIPVDLAVS